MNCKQGDLALVISGLNVGMSVTCLEFVGEVVFKDGSTSTFLDCWLVDREMMWKDVGQPDAPPTYSPHAPDQRLMPINGTGDHTKEHTRDLESVQ